MDKFNFIMPAEIVKSTNGEWKVAGLASTERIDQQGETIIQKGIDLSPIDKKRGLFNWDHDNSPENTIGIIDGYKRGSNGLYVEGRLFKNHTKAKAVREIMESLSEGDRGRLGMSVEGQIIERDPDNPKIIKKCRIKNVALTLNPVNSGTYADLVKSMNSAHEIEFDSHEVESSSKKDSGQVTFTADQVMEMIQKALGVGAPGMQAPADRSGGDALAMESMDSDKKKKVKKKKMKKMDKAMYKSNLMAALDKIQVVHPNMTRSQLWEALKDRLQQTFPDINEEFGKGRGPDKAPRKKKVLNTKLQVSKYEERPGAKKLREKVENKQMKEKLKPSNVFGLKKPSEKK